ncbi:hypothetical protein [Amycolatopsis aidingensis]|uniref:hypothetical protein n=1 Tax=Amycolatopsis aidingensis TaxID=2842453 RepID=UPI001C0C1CDD|nr:hypothetical protein [Amycolatopsis aidingensis]
MSESGRFGGSEGVDGPVGSEVLVSVGSAPVLVVGSLPEVSDGVLLEVSPGLLLEVSTGLLSEVGTLASLSPVSGVESASAIGTIVIATAAPMAAARVAILMVLFNVIPLQRNDLAPGRVPITAGANYRESAIVNQVNNQCAISQTPAVTPMLCGVLAGENHEGS